MMKNSLRNTGSAVTSSKGAQSNPSLRIMFQYVFRRIGSAICSSMEFTCHDVESELGIFTQVVVYALFI